MSLPLRTDQMSTLEEVKMMSDPAFVSYRIFVGCLPTKNMRREDLVNLFKVFGPISGAVLNRGFGFVQFESEESALRAVYEENFSYQGRVLTIKPARKTMKPLIFEGGADFSEGRDRSPIGEPIMDRMREPTKFPVEKRSNPTYIPELPQSSTNNINDIEIVVIDRRQTEYAEYIETKLRRLGFSVDILYPKGDVPVTRVITNIANKGCLFAMVIQPQNEELRSVTLNILHGPPQEHRNMPLEDAIALVSRSYQAYKLKENPFRPLKIPMASAAPVASLNERHPDNIQVLLNLLADNRVLTALQYDTVISYLTKRRETQVKIELGDVTPPPPKTETSVSVSTGSMDKQQELQSRILSILNSKKTSVQTAPKPSLLSDQSVQKALNSIFEH